MNESDARRTLLVRAHEEPLTPPWTEADARAASDAAARAAGESAAPGVYIAQRARLAMHQLVEREPALRGIQSALAWPRGIGTIAAVMGVVVGVASDAVGSSQRINILAPPLLVLLVWNVIVFTALVVAAVLPGRPAGPLRRAIGSVARSLTARALRRTGGEARPALLRFAEAWFATTRQLMTARLAMLLHGAAAALVIGALASLYLRGLAFEYRASWESTFLTADAVHSVIHAVLGPASRLSGIALPDATNLQALRSPPGIGENAARWIHLWALTLGAAVLLPRLALATASAWRVRRLQAHLPLDLEAPYFQRLMRARSGEAAIVDVLPYSYRVHAGLLTGLTAALQQELGTRVDLRLADSIPPGDEEALALHLQKLDAERRAGSLLALFPLTATPERETHGAFVDALAALRPGRVSVLIDESGFRSRFPGAEGEARLEQRRAAWQRLLQEHGQQPRFANLMGDLSSLQQR